MPTSSHGFFSSKTINFFAISLILSSKISLADTFGLEVDFFRLSNN
jgi:hypothetical protein